MVVVPEAGFVATPDTATAVLDEPNLDLTLDDIVIDEEADSGGA